MDPQKSDATRRTGREPRRLTLPTREPPGGAGRQQGDLFPQDWLDAWETGAVVVPTLGGNASGTLPPAAVSLHAGSFTRRRTGGAVVDAPTRAADPFADLERIDAVENIATVMLPAIGAGDVSMLTTTRLPAVVVGTETYLGLIRRLAQTSGIYALATLASPLVSLGLAPFLTRYLSLGEYGTLTLLNSLTALLAGISQLGLGSAFFRAYNYDYSDERGKRSVLGTILLLLGVVSLLMSGLLAFFAPWIAENIFQQPALAKPLIVTSWALLVQNLTVPGFSWLRAESKAGLFAALSIANVLVSLVANLTLVGALGLGVNGSLLATGSGYAVVALFTLPPLILSSHLHVRREVALSMLAFGLPLVLNFISFWVLQLSDRYLLALLGSLSETAHYAVAYSLGGVISTIIMGPFTLAWPAAMFNIAKRPDAARVYRVVFRWFTTLLLLAAFGLSIAARLILVWFFPESYHAAADIIPVIAESLVFYGVYYVFMVGANIRRKTWLAAVFTTFAALLNVGLNLVLIPLYQALGAAAATLLSYMAMAALAYVVNQRLYPVPFQVFRFILAFILGNAIYVATYALTDIFGVQYQWPIAFGGLLVFAICLFFLVDGGRAIPVTRLAAPALRSRVPGARAKGAS